ncbi:MAG: ArsR family transcriptional regulator [Chloroflexi bacterium]|nr:ArsR family transcriptional regulator [Chloroflexota bacterium]
MEGTRLHILTTLQKDGHGTVESLGQALQLAPATIRRHMDILQRDRLVSFQEVKKPTGRPEYSFFLTEAGHEMLPKDYQHMLGALFQEMTSLEKEEIDGRDGRGLMELLLYRIARSIAERAQVPSEANIGQRVAALASVLEKERFTPQVAQESHGITIRLFNCPFRSVALQHDSICRFDSHLISLVLGTEVSLMDCVARGDSSCCYIAPYENAPSQASPGSPKA